MKQIGEAIPNSRSPALRPASGTAVRRGPLPANQPPVMNRMTDIEIPKAWENWIPADGKRRLRRALTEPERFALMMRRDELAPWVAGYEGPNESEEVVLALADMFGAFRSMRQDGESMIGQVDATRRALAEFPLWAIQKACASIRLNGVLRDGSYDRQWPPNDADIVAEVRDKLRLYGDQYRSAVALLEAEVER